MSKQIKIKKHLVFKRIIFILILAATFYVIFNFSAQNGDESSSVSTKVTNIIIDVVAKVKTVTSFDRVRYIAKLEPIVRKIAHFSIYSIVGFSVMGFLCTFDIKNKYKLLLSIFVGVVYAFLDEFHQSFVPGRSARLFDVGIDSVGVLVGIFIMMLLIILFEDIADWLKR